MIYRIKNTNDDTIKNVSVIKDYQNLLTANSPLFSSYINFLYMIL